jgi:glycosyltransferase involved in cell wall biosynthesis
MKAIFLTRDNPNPPVNGYKKRNYYLLKELKLRNIETFVFNAEVKKNTIQKIIKLIASLFSGIPFSVKIRTDKKTKQGLKQRYKENLVDLIICDGIHRSLNIPFDLGVTKILYEHNIESEIAGRYARLERNIFKKTFAYMEYFKFKQLQKNMWPKFDYCIACSDIDKKFIERITDKNKVITVNNGVDLGYFEPGTSPVEPDTLVYTGQIGWHPNEDALIYFIKEILPIISKVTPNLKFWIVGGQPSARIKSFAKKNKNIMVTGFVDDVREYISRAAVYIVPLRIGSGTRLKILEAMSMKKAIVSTSIGSEGLEVENNKHLLIRDNPKEFAQAVIELLRDENLRLKLGVAGRKLVEEKYDWKKVFKDLDKILS